MKVIRVILTVFLVLAFAAVILFGVFYYLIWPKHDILGLVPNTPLAYIAASDLEETISAIETSEFADRFARSSLWRDIKLSRLVQQAQLQKRSWERYVGPIKPDEISQLVKKDALLAFYKGESQGHPDFLLISEVGLLTRFNITSGSTKRSLISVYGFTEEEYRDFDLMTVAILGWDFTYVFIGRVGLLGTNKALLKKAIDMHKDGEHGLAGSSEFKELIVGLPESKVSLYMNVADSLEANILSHASSLKTGTGIDPRLRYLLPITQNVDSWAGVAFSKYGSLRFDAKASHDASLQYESSDLPDSRDLSNAAVVPDNCLLFVSHDTSEPELPFEMLEEFTGSDLDIIKDRLGPVLHNGAAIAVFEPNIKELQLLPPVMLLLRVKDRASAEAELEDVRNSLKIGHRQLEFVGTKYENTAIHRSRVPIGMGLSLDASYAFIGDDLLVIATDISALKAAIDVSFNKRGSLMEDENYVAALSPAAKSIEGLEGRIFINLRSVATITKQAARMYAWRAKIAGDRETEQLATMLHENIFIIEAWQYMGVTLDSDNGKTALRLVLDTGN